MRSDRIYNERPSTRWLNKQFSSGEGLVALGVLSNGLAISWAWLMWKYFQLNTSPLLSNRMDGWNISLWSWWSDVTGKKSGNNELKLKYWKYKLHISKVLQAGK